jgi:hypothetical protein
MKSFSTARDKQRANPENTRAVREAGAGRHATRGQDPAGLAWLCARRAMENCAGSLLPHRKRLRRMSCLPAFIVDTGQSAASMALH